MAKRGHTRSSAELASLFGGNTALAVWSVAMTGNRIMPMQGALPLWEGNQCLARSASVGRGQKKTRPWRASAWRPTGFSATPS